VANSAARARQTRPGARADPQLVNRISPCLLPTECTARNTVAPGGPAGPCSRRRACRPGPHSSVASWRWGWDSRHAPRQSRRPHIEHKLSAGLCDVALGGSEEDVARLGVGGVRRMRYPCLRMAGAFADPAEDAQGLCDIRLHRARI
jgi:hypothetical protein